METTGWYASREAIKAALEKGADRHRSIDLVAAAATREIERELNRHFYPVTRKREYPWPQMDGRWNRLFLDEDLLAVTSLTRDGDDEVVMDAADYLLEPVNEGPPYYWIDIHLGRDEFYQSAPTTHQRAIRVTGRWGYSENTESAGVIDDASGISISDTILGVSDASLIDVGNVLLIESESIYVKGRDTKDTGANLTQDLTRDVSDVTVTTDDLSKINVGEIIKIESEEMIVRSRSAATGAGTFTVERAHEGTLLAAHSQPQDILAYRNLTIQRGVNGTTAATHADATAISRYVPPEDVQLTALAVAEFYYQHSGAGWTGELGGGDAIAESKGMLIKQLIRKLCGHMRRHVVGAI